MIWLGGLLVYGVIAFTLARPVAGDLAWRLFDSAKQTYPHMNRHLTRPNTSQWLGAGIAAVVLMALWPVVCPAAMLWRVAGQHPIGREREQRVAEQRARIAELERELELR